MIYKDCKKEKPLIIGLGTDIIECARVQHALQKQPRLGDELFSAAEKEYCQARKVPWPCFAARFAAKEAFFKALGTGWLGQCAWHEVQVGHDEKGKPMLELLGKAATLPAQYGFNCMHLSLSHIKETATATVILEKND